MTQRAFATHPTDSSRHSERTTNGMLHDVLMNHHCRILFVFSRCSRARRASRCRIPRQAGTSVLARASGDTPPVPRAGLWYGDGIRHQKRPGAARAMRLLDEGLSRKRSSIGRAMPLRSATPISPFAKGMSSW